MDRTFSIKTLGCKLNQYDSSIITSQLLENGWTAKPFGDDEVDLVIINTCTVTDRSDKKCRNYIRQGAKFSKSGKVFVTGCLVDRDADGTSKMPEVHNIYKNSEKDLILEGINKFYESIHGIDKTQHASGLKSREGEKNISEKVIQNKITTPARFSRTRGFIKIQDGCDGECSYCVIPSVRGKPNSRSTNDILEQAKSLIDMGCPELILTGITIGKYNSDNKALPDLIEKITNLSGNFRVRISSIEPNHVSDEFVGMLENDKVCNHVHVPLQSGSDNVLNAMKRQYTARDFVRITEKIRSSNRDISIGTDIIIGFPGESDEYFKDSLKMIEDIGFSYVHQFTFSPRSGTPAGEMKQNCTHQEIGERAKRMRELSGRTGLEYRERFVNKVLSSVIEKNKNREGYSAVSDNYIRISLEDSPLNQKKVGQIADVKLVKTEISENFGLIITDKGSDG